MAVFEKRKSIKLSLDDSVSLQCTMELAQNVKDHTVSYLNTTLVAVGVSVLCKIQRILLQQSSVWGWMHYTIHYSTTVGHGVTGQGLNCGFCGPENLRTSSFLLQLLHIQQKTTNVFLNL
jgi:hypothetical protein